MKSWHWNITNNFSSWSHLKRPHVLCSDCQLGRFSTLFTQASHSTSHFNKQHTQTLEIIQLLQLDINAGSISLLSFSKVCWWTWSNVSYESVGMQVLTIPGFSSRCPWWAISLMKCHLGITRNAFLKLKS